MKLVPFPANTQTNSPYEPKSVLEIHRSTSPPVSSTTTTAGEILTVCDDDPDLQLQLEDDHELMINQHQYLVGWDSLMRDLGLHDDSETQITTPSQLISTIPHQSQPVTSFDSNHFMPSDFSSILSDIPLNNNSDAINSFDVGFDYVDDLVRLADSFDTNSFQLGPVILAQLNQRLTSPTGKPLRRATFYFKEALRSLRPDSTRPSHYPTNNSSEIIQTIKAHKTFSDISPIPMFASFTANQAVLDALDGSMHVHVIDFDIGLGGHWASFMKELAHKADFGGAAPPVLRISAIVREGYATESRLIRDNLTQFGCELNIRFEIDFVLLRTFEYLSFKAIKFVDGAKLALLLSPAIFRHVGTGFLNDLRQLSPHVVVHMDVEGQTGLATRPTTSYRLAVIDGLEFYSALLESLEAANDSNNSGDWMRGIERFVVFPKIVEAVGRQGPPCREALVAAGLRQVGLGRFAEFQAECLVRRVQVRGFHVVKRQGEMLLCWHDRPLVATSAWTY
ncbi:hypothetical protein BUALT_Bualt04G0077200 [Buddleja alternifolia]|uniref:Scarecrow-like protein 15 n=1 Tax=Buddleja alternifolia TaxID=168488 RepID=A0AAV6XYC1_9LAMI|nr:hypothetical protein BUALT_Bualt04G0077200 [Buddleja alternifolia]